MFKKPGISHEHSLKNKINANQVPCRYTGLVSTEVLNCIKLHAVLVTVREQPQGCQFCLTFLNVYVKSGLGFTFQQQLPDLVVTQPIYLSLPDEAYCSRRDTRRFEQDLKVLSLQWKPWADHT